MPINLKDLQSRIKSVKNTQQITKAMKLVSAAKFGRAQTAVINARPYTLELAHLVQKLAYFVRGGCSIPLLTQNSSKNALVIVASSDRGLCAGFNVNVVKHVQKVWDSLKSDNYNISTVCIGKKAFQSLSRKAKDQNLFSQKDITHLTEVEYIEFPKNLLNSKLTLITTVFDLDPEESLHDFAETIASLYANAHVGKIVLVFSKFQSAMLQIPNDETILPLSINHLSNVNQKLASGKQELASEGEPIFEPERDELLASILPRYVTSQIVNLFLESRASEHGARMTAMDNATRNGKEMERKLRITYQRARQAANTNELIEIISGAESL